MNGTIRRARWWDAMDLLRLQEGCWPSEYRSTGLEVVRHTMAPWRTYVVDGFRDLLGALVVVEVDSILVVDSVEVAPGARRLGFARAMLERALGDTDPEVVSYAVAHGVTGTGRMFLEASGFGSGPGSTKRHGIGRAPLYQRLIGTGP